MTKQQEHWLKQNPEFKPIGPPRSVKFAEWGTLYANGTYYRMDDKPRQAIRVGEGAMGVVRLEES